MANLSGKQQSFIEMMQKSEEHAAKGFELLARQTDPEIFFSVLESAGFFDPSNAPGIIETKEVGYYKIPFWPALDYLQAISKLAGQTDDIDIARKIVEIIRNVSTYDKHNNTLRDNSNTFRKFADFLGVLPLDAITLEELDLLPTWLGSRFNPGMVTRAIDKGILQRLLESDHEDDWKKACRILRHCTAVRWAKHREFQEDTTLPTSVVDSYWLAELVKNSTPQFSTKAGATAAEIFLERLREIFGGSRSHRSWIWRPAIEDHEQNHPFYKTENIFVDGLRNIVLGWIDKDVDNARPFVQHLLQDNLEVARRIGIHILNERWSILNNLYSNVITSELFESGQLHEAHVLLRTRFSEFDRTLQDKTLEALREMPPPEIGAEGEELLKRLQLRWLTAIIGKGYQPADDLFRDLSTELGIKGSPSHPDFHFFWTVHHGTGPTPLEAQKLVSFAEEGKIIEKLDAFKPENKFDGPTIEALVEALEEAVQQSPDIFLMLLPKFATAKRPYQYGIINGFKALWDTSEDKHHTVDWAKTWPSLLSMFEELLRDPAFWNEQVEQSQGLIPSRNWIPPLIADFLRAGTESDEKAYPPELLYRGYKLIQILLDRCEPERVCPDDPMFQADNSSKGRAIKALVNHALRACRLSDKNRGEHRGVWDEHRDAFDSEIDKCQDSNYEFSTLVALYLPNLMYLDPDWVPANIKRIFPSQHLNNLMCALDGIAYANVSDTLYKLLLEKGIVDFSLPLELKGRYTRERLIERIILAYLRGDETLDSLRFAYLFSPGRTEDLRCATSFLSHIGRSNLSESQTERILKFWERCLEWGRKEPQTPTRLLTNLSRLILHLDSIRERELPWLLEVAPHVHIDYNSDHFITELRRLVDGSPAEVVIVLRKLFENSSPIYDYSETLPKLLKAIAAKGYRDDAIELADKIRGHIPDPLNLYKELTEDH